MANKVAQMTNDEFIAVMEDLIERKLLEMIGDPDEGLEIRESVRERLLRQNADVEAGERGIPLQNTFPKIQMGVADWFAASTPSLKEIWDNEEDAIYDDFFPLAI